MPAALLPDRAPTMRPRATSSSAMRSHVVNGATKVLWRRLTRRLTVRCKRRAAMNSVSELSQHRFDVRATAGSHFAWMRTRLSLERTMMSWVRTAITLIGFGFTIVQFFEHLGPLTGEPLRRPLAPFYFGLLLIGAGIVALVVAGWQYRTVIAYMRQGEFAAIA
ncbi:MAG: DUF202 domain-containing protein, partial [Lysobacterales bacterium]